MIEDICIPFLSKVLTPRRMAHSLGVMQMMGELAAVYELDIDTAQTIGILHDAGKDLPPDVQQQLINEGNIQIQNEAEKDYVLYLHAPVSAYFIQRELGITNELILGAIATHCYYGDNPYFDDPYSWCLRFSDVLEPTRHWENEEIILDGTNRLRKVAYEGKIWEGAFIMSEAIIDWFTAKGFPIHPNYYDIRRRMASRVNRT